MKLIEQRLWWRNRALIRLCWRIADRITQYLMQSHEKRVRASNSGRNNDAAEFGIGQIERVINSPERQIINAFTMATSDNPIRENDGDIGGVNNFGAVRSSGQFFWHGCNLQKGTA